MFLQYAPAGAVLPLYSYQLKALQFTPMEMAWCCSTQALAALIGPLAAGQMADRWFPAQRCITACSALCAILLWVLADLTAPAAMFVATLGFWLVMTPVFTLGTSLSFANLQRPDQDFGLVRMFGTIGWMLAGIAVGYWYFDPPWLCDMVARWRPDHPTHLRADAFRVGAILSFALCLYSLTLPSTLPTRRGTHWLAPAAAVRLLHGRPFAVYFGCVLGLYITVPFTSQVTPLLLSSHGVTEAWLPATMTIGQVFEVVSLAVLPMVLLRFGVRGTMILGLSAWLVSLCVQTIGQPVWLVISSLSLNGLYVTCFIVAGQVFVNRHAHGEIRASAQALLTVMVGAGLLVGNLLVGLVRDLVHEAFAPTFAVAAAMTVLLLAGFVAGFHEEPAAVIADADAEAEADVPTQSPVDSGVSLPQAMSQRHAH